MFLMWNSKTLIDGDEDEQRQLLCLRPQFSCPHGCRGGLGYVIVDGITSGGGRGGKGGCACYNDSCASYGSAELPCELGSGIGGGNSTGSTAAGGIIGWQLCECY